MLKKILLSSILSIIATNAFAVSSTVTSKDYVDDLVATKQVKIPSAGTAGTPAGETVITYTASNGQIGERALFTGANEYDSANDAGKLITASALNNAFTNLPETETTKLTCTDSNCLLYNIITQTAYGITPFNPDVSINGTGKVCVRSLNNSYNLDTNGACNADTLSYLGALGNGSGKWGVVFPYGDVSGISVCSNLYIAVAGFENRIATDAQNERLNSEYSDQADVGAHCWCKLENPVTSRWVYNGAYADEGCLQVCANECAGGLRGSASFREAVFGGN